MQRRGRPYLYVAQLSIFRYDVETLVRMLLLVGFAFLISACTGYTDQGEALYHRSKVGTINDQ